MDEPTTPGTPGHDLPKSTRAGFETRAADRDRTLAAIHRLEAALGHAAPGRHADWLRAVRANLEVLDDAIRVEEANASEPDSLLADIERTQRRLRHRVHGIRAQYRQIRNTVEQLRAEIDDDNAALDVADIRQRLSWLLNALRYQRARESDLIYEAYCDAFDHYPHELPPDPR